jgi:glutaredoxin
MKTQFSIVQWTCLYGFFLLWMTACQGESQDQSLPKAPQVKTGGSIEIDVNRENLMMIYQDDKGVNQAVSKFEELPHTAKGQVQIIDLSQSPEQRNANDLIAIFDLTKADKHPIYQGKWVSRKQVEKEYMERRAKEEESKPKYYSVTLYETSWCGYCKKAKAFLQEKQIPFTFFDIEKDQKAAEKLQATARAQNFPLGGVPVLEINGKLISGFDPNQIMSLAQVKASKN